jgi:urease gamma subunit
VPRVAVLCGDHSSVHSVTARIGPYTEHTAQLLLHLIGPYARRRRHRGVHCPVLCTRIATFAHAVRALTSDAREDRSTSER